MGLLCWLTFFNPSSMFMVVEELRNAGVCDLVGGGMFYQSLL